MINEPDEDINLDFKNDEGHQQLQHPLDDNLPFKSPVADLPNEDEHIKCLVWNELSYSVQLKVGRIPCWKKKIEKTLIEDVSGYVDKGELLAIIGGSGAGKSTLLDVLAGRKTGGKQTGKILYNGRLRDKYFQRYAAYVTQDDVHVASLTVRENLIYAALLRLPQSMPFSVKRDRVEAIIELLGLTSCADTRVGNALTRGISGGESRRLSIATELLSGPELIFLDEPTSGLDSSASVHVMKMLRKIANSQKKAIVFSIHQPSEDIFRLFDKLMLLGKSKKSKVGKMVYFGPAKDALSYFSAGGYQCPMHCNPADFLMSMAGGLRGEAEEEERDAEALRDRELSTLPLVDVDAQQERFLQSTQHSDVVTKTRRFTAAPLPPHRNPSKLARWRSQHTNSAAHHPPHLSSVEDPHEEHPNTSLNSPHKQEEHQSEFLTSVFFQFAVLVARSYQSMMRQPSFFAVRILRLLAIALLVATTYYQIDTDQKGVQDRISLIFFCAISTFMNAMGLIATFLEGRPLFVRERAAKLYRVVAYFASTLLTVWPFDIINGIFFSSLVYWIAGLNDDVSAFFFFMLVYLMTIFALSAYILLMSAVSVDAQAASTLAPLIFSLFMIFAGFLVLPDNIPPWYIWVYYISPLRYTLQLLIYNEFHDQTFDCDETKVGNTTTTSLCAFPTGEDVLDFYDVDDNIGLNLAILFIFQIVMLILCYLSLVYRRFDKR